MFLNNIQNVIHWNMPSVQKTKKLWRSLDEIAETMTPFYNGANTNLGLNIADFRR